MKKQFLLVLIMLFFMPVAKARLAVAAGASALFNGTAAIPSGNFQESILYAGGQTGDNTLDLKAVSHFQNAVSFMRPGSYRRSLSEFQASRKGLPFLADYILFYEARACRGLNDPERSAVYLNRLLKNYPRSPLVKRAKLMAIGMAGDKDTLVQLLEDFTKRYHGHEDMELRLAQLLKEKGETNRAGDILKKLYIQAGDLSGEALAELGRQPTSAEQLQRAGNLIRRGNHGQAEHELLLLPDDPGYLKAKLDLLGEALFMGKKYNEAASVYASAADLYQAGRSYYRAGDEEDLKKSIDALSQSNDKRISYLLLDLASIERRKDRNFSGAIQDLKEAREKYPWIAEEALWETAWLHYLQKDYKDAASAFSSLSRLYGEPEYLYWTAKSLEDIGGSENANAAAGIYKKLVQEDEGYYSVLASIKTGIPVKEDTLPEQAVRDLKSSASFMRFKVLTMAGLKNEALSDLSYSARNSMDRRTLVWIANQLKNLGAFRNAISVAMRLPGDMQPANVMYPHAFWGRIEKDCSTTGLDPYLVLSVMREESRFDPKVCSAAGAIGLMQLMPKTAKKYSGPLRIVIKNRDSIYSIDANVALGTFYLNKLFNDFKTIPPTLAAYNAGEAVVRKWLAQGHYASFDEFVEDIPYDETKNYIKRIITTYYKYGGEDAAKGFFLAAKTGNP